MKSQQVALYLSQSYLELLDNEESEWMGCLPEDLFGIKVDEEVATEVGAKGMLELGRSLSA